MSDPVTVAPNGKPWPKNWAKQHFPHHQLDHDTANCWICLDGVADEAEPEAEL